MNILELLGDKYTDLCTVVFMEIQNFSVMFLYYPTQLRLTKTSIF